MKINLITVWEIREDTVRSMRERERERETPTYPSHLLFSPIFHFFPKFLLFIYFTTCLSVIRKSIIKSDLSLLNSRNSRLGELQEEVGLIWDGTTGGSRVTFKSPKM